MTPRAGLIFTRFVRGRQARRVNTPGRGTRQEFSNIRRDAPEQYRDTTAGGQLAEFPHSRRDATAYAATPLRRLNPHLAGQQKGPGSSWACSQGFHADNPKLLCLILFLRWNLGRPHREGGFTPCRPLCSPTAQRGPRRRPGRTTSDPHKGFFFFFFLFFFFLRLVYYSSEFQSLCTIYLVCRFLLL